MSLPDTNNWPRIPKDGGDHYRIKTPCLVMNRAEQYIPVVPVGDTHYGGSCCGCAADSANIDGDIDTASANYRDVTCSNMPNCDKIVWAPLTEKTWEAHVVWRLTK